MTRPRPGFFVTLEGGEGSGKSTLAQTLAISARKEGLETLVTREPGGTPGADMIRDVLLSGAVKPLGAFAEALLFSAARSEHVSRIIRPALARGAVVICDRFIDSTRAYQGYVGGVAVELLDGLERLSIGSTRPDLTLLLDLDPALAVKRRANRATHADRFEQEDHLFHQRLREAFLVIAAAAPERCHVINATQTEMEVSQMAWHFTRQRLSAHGLVLPT